jgi:glycosyltransferase involved in cell wall biosynthesis
VFHIASRAEARAALRLDAESEVVVFVGWIAPTKGLRELIEATIKLRNSHPRLQLFCVGEGALQAELEARAAEVGAAENIRFLGRRSSVEVARCLAAANIFCLPSYAEGCPNSVVEALNCGRAVVATNVGGIPELVDNDSGFLIEPRDPSALADALNDALSRPWDESGISQRSRRGWDQVAKETFEICTECLRTGSTRPRDRGKS